MGRIGVNILSSVIRRSLSSFHPKVAPSQEASFKERCLLVDELDRQLGWASKYDCHRVQPDGGLLLHRAFSVFLFNSKNELLMQKRAPTKVTFPNCVTNSCCSHPIQDFPAEMEEMDAIGIKLAAKRRLNYELGIPYEEVELKDLIFLTRIIYKSLGDGTWGEYELDYVLFLHKDVTLNPNVDEISELAYVKQENMKTFLESQKDPLSPWFELIAANYLPKWWSNLHNIRAHQDHETINKFSNL